MFYEGINSGYKYFCDRCGVTKLREDEYTNNHMINGCRYCDECRCYIKLQVYKCIYCNKSETKRSERILPMVCDCGGLVVCLSK